MLVVTPNTKRGVWLDRLGQQSPRGDNMNRPISNEKILFSALNKF